MDKQDVNIIFEDLYELVEYARETYTEAGFLSVKHSATAIREVLVKDIDTKPIYKAGTHSRHYLCPTCNRIYWEKESLGNYCISCGQKFNLD